MEPTEPDLVTRYVSGLLGSEVFIALLWGISLATLAEQGDPLPYFVILVGFQSLHWFLLSCAEMRSLVGQVQTFHFFAGVILMIAQARPSFTLFLWCVLVVLVWSMVRWAYGEIPRRDALQRRLSWGVAVMEATLCALWTTTLYGHIPEPLTSLAVPAQWGLMISMLVHQSNVLVLFRAEPDLCRVIWIAQCFHLAAAVHLYRQSPNGSVMVPGSVAWAFFCVFSLLLASRQVLKPEQNFELRALGQTI